MTFEVKKKKRKKLNHPAFAKRNKFRRNTLYTEKKKTSRFSVKIRMDALA